MPYTGPLDGLGKALRTLRKRSGLTQKEVARLLETQQSAISDWENDANLEVAGLDRFLAVLGFTLMDVAELLPATKASPAGSGGRSIDPKALRRELDAALERAGVPEADEDELRRRDNAGWGCAL